MEYESDTVEEMQSILEAAEDESIVGEIYDEIDIVEDEGIKSLP